MMSHTPLTETIGNTLYQGVIRSRARPVCACCGKRHGRRVTEEKRADWIEGDPEPTPPATNLTIVSRTVERYGEAMDGSGRKRDMIRWTLWDGERWLARYDPFCTLRCALEFARAAHRAGYRSGPAK